MTLRGNTDPAERPLRISVDLRVLDRAWMGSTGLARYAIEVTSGLARRRPAWHVVAHTNHPDRLDQQPNLQAMSTKWPVRNPVGRIAWLHLRAARESVPRPDVWLGPAFVLPPRPESATAVTVHDLAFLLERRHYRGRLNTAYALHATRRSALSATRVLCGSAWTARLIEKHLDVPRDRIIVTPYGVAKPFLGERRRTPGDYLLFVGVFEARKGLETLYAAFQAVAKVHPELRLVLAGRPGWGTRSLLSDLRADARVHFVISPSDEVLVELYASAALLAFPSRMEGFGLPAAEALAMGCPVVSSDLPTVREFAGEVPVYVPVEDAMALAEAIEEILVDQTEAEARASAARVRMRQFTWERTAEMTARALADTTAGRTADR
jgi:glycosyltransferase involved in cell wall biosynthesis